MRRCPYGETAVAQALRPEPGLANEKVRQALGDRPDDAGRGCLPQRRHEGRRGGGQGGHARILGLCGRRPRQDAELGVGEECTAAIRGRDARLHADAEVHAGDGSLGNARCFFFFLNEPRGLSVSDEHEPYPWQPPGCRTLGAQGVDGGRQRHRVRRRALPGGRAVGHGGVVWSPCSRQRRVAAPVLARAVHSSSVSVGVGARQRRDRGRASGPVSSQALGWRRARLLRDIPFFRRPWTASRTLGCGSGGAAWAASA